VTDKSGPPIRCDTRDGPDGQPHHRRVNAADGPASSFTAVICQLVQITRHSKAADFLKTAIKGEDLERLSRLLSELAELKAGRPPQTRTPVRVERPDLASNEAVT
jgi:hypothetical protein